MVCYANGGKLSLICDICYLKTGSFDLFKPLTVIHMQGCTLSFTRTQHGYKKVCVIIGFMKLLCVISVIIVLKIMLSFL